MRHRRHVETLHGGLGRDLHVHLAGSVRRRRRCRRRRSRSLESECGSTSVVTISSCFRPLAAMSVRRWSSGWPRSRRGPKISSILTEMMVVEFDLRAVAELIFEIFGERLRVIREGLQRRADPVDIAHGDAGLLEAESDRATRQLAARMVRQRESLLLRGCDQLAVAQQNRRTVVMPVLDPRADSNHLHVA